MTATAPCDICLKPVPITEDWPVDWAVCSECRERAEPNVVLDTTNAHERTCIVCERPTSNRHDLRDGEGERPMCLACVNDEEADRG